MARQEEEVGRPAQKEYCIECEFCGFEFIANGQNYKEVKDLARSCHWRFMEGKDHLVVAICPDCVIRASVLARAVW